MKTKIMFIIWALEVGGAERLLVKLAQNIPKSSYDISLVCISREGVWADELKQAGIDVICMNKRTGFDPFILPRLIKLIKRMKPDIVNTYLWTADLWGRLAAICAGVKNIVVTEQNVDIWKRWYHISIDKILFRWTQYAICVSDEVVNYYKNVVGLKDKQLVMIPNAIDISLFNRDTIQGELRTQLGIKDNEFIFTCSARLHVQKAHEVLIEAVNILNNNSDIDFCVLLVGEGQRNDELRNLVETKRLNNRIKFLGLRQDIPNILLQSDAFVLSSDYEGLSLAILEAMAARLPIVATTVGGNTQVVDNGVTGFLVPPRDPLLLADAMSHLVKDLKLAKQMGNSGRALVEGKYDIRSVTEQTLGLFNSFWGQNVS